MRDIETKISPFVQNMFPQFYKEDGENFITFVKAYYEWLEQNHQELTLESNTGFVAGDSVTQGNTTGTVVSVENNIALVKVNGFDSFRCNVLCNDYIPLTSTSGGNSYIKIQKNVNPLYHARNLLNIRDVDSTLEQYIVHFKEKYLKNIQFDVATNKKLLIKNSLDLYRSKGTARSIDLFFRLIYGTNAEVEYPGEKIFRLSDGEWYRPLYLEVTGDRRSIQLVGKQVTGVTSGATAFVEKYIKRKIKEGIVHVLYLSNVKGTFENNEFLKSDAIYNDSPKVVGSLTSVEIISGSKLFQVGDIVSFNSVRGDYGRARVESVNESTGVVDFIFIDGGWGYSESADSSYSAGDLAKRTQSIVSEKVLTLSNVRVSNTVSTITVGSTGGSSYQNNDLVVVNGAFQNAVGRIETDGSGVITSVVVTTPGAGFYSLNPTSYTITNPVGLASTGSSANLVITTAAHNRYFNYLETINQPFRAITYGNATNNQLFTLGGNVHIGNSSGNVAFGVILANANGTLAQANGLLTISITSGSFGAGNTVYLTSNASVRANVASVSNSSARATIMGIPSNAAFAVTSLLSGTIVRDDEIYQVNSANVEVANATVVLADLAATAGSIEITDLKGVFVPQETIKVRHKATTATLSDITFTTGIYDVAVGSNFQNTYNAYVFSSNTGTTGNVTIVSAGSGASFKVGTIGESEMVYFNTDMLKSNNSPSVGSNQTFMSVNIDAAAYGFPKAPGGNSGSVILNCLYFDNFLIGSIGSLTSINPGAGYTVDPYVLAYQPFIAPFDKRDYILRVENTVGVFQTGERILQQNVSATAKSLTVANSVPFEVGMFVQQNTANGYITSITDGTNTILVANVQGTFAANATTLVAFNNTAVNTTISAVTTESIVYTGKGIIKAGSNTSALNVKRIQFENVWGPTLQIVGQESGATANIVSVDFADELPIGLNAVIDANSVTATGSVAALEIIDSGIGYANSEIMLYTSEDGRRSGEAKASVSGLGTGSGYYRTSKGFLSSDISKIHDGEYYQEYSYEILSRIPLDKYQDMFLKVMHTAGTKMFGAVEIDDKANVLARHAFSSVTIS
jgi:hypothetical protein